MKSKYDTKDIQDALIEAESTTLRRIEEEITRHEQQQEAWQALSKDLSRLRDSAKELFGFQNPFNDRMAESSAAAVLTATAARDALEGEKQLLVRHMATADRFASASLATDFKVEEGTYRFSIGDVQTEFRFPGGSIEQLADRINRKAGKLLDARVIKNTAETEVFIIEAKRTGTDSRLLFFDAAEQFGLTAGIFEDVGIPPRAVPITKYSLQAWTKRLQPESFLVAEGELTLSAGAEARIPLKPPAALNENMVLEFEVRTEIIPEEPVEEVKPPPGPSIPTAGVAEFQDVIIKNEKSQVILPEWKPPERPQRVDDMQILYVETSLGDVYALDPLVDTKEYQLYQIPTGDIDGEIGSLNVANRNTHRKITFRDFTIFDETTRGKHKPLHALSEAGDAVVEMDGIEIVRSDNTIDDLIPGVILSLHDSDPEPVTLTIEGDTESTKDAIIAFVGNYNRVANAIDILTRNDDSIVEDARYLTEDEKEEAIERLGLFLGDLALMQLKSTLQRVMMSPYQTDGARSFSLLAHAGISTDARRPGTEVTLDRTRLRGYLEIDEETLDGALSTHTDWLKQLFGDDTDGDFIVDSGVAYSLDSFLKPYVRIGGILASRIATLDTRITGARRDLAREERDLDEYKLEVKSKYAQMEAALDALEQSSTTLQNLNRGDKE